MASGQGGSVYSFSFSSADARYVTEDGAYVFDMIAHAPRMKAVRIQLATLELALSQTPVECDWSRVHFGEGYRLSPGGHRFTLQEVAGGSGSHTVAHHEIALPVYLNELTSLEIVQTAPDGSLDLRVRTAEPHNLFVLPSPQGHPLHPEGSNLARCWMWGDPVRLVGTPLGDVAFDPSRLGFVDSHTFTVKGARSGHAPTKADVRGWLHAPVVPGPLHLAYLLDCALPYCGTQQAYRAGIDSRSGGLVLHANELTHPPSDRGQTPTGVQVKLGGDGLAVALGVQGAEAVWRPGPSGGVLGVTAVQSVTDAGADLPPSMNAQDPSEVLAIRARRGAWTLESVTTPRHIVSGQGYQGGVGAGQLPVGWYDISVRPVGAHGTFNFQAAWGEALQPLLLRPPSPNGMLAQHMAQASSPYFLTFASSTGTVHRVYVPMGSYTASGMAGFLGAAMTRLSRADGGSEVEVRATPHPTDRHLVRFAFGVKQSTGVLPAPPRFGLLFATGTLNPRKLGFAETDYTGANAYLSPEYVCVPNLSTDPAQPERAPRGVWGATVLGQCRRLRFTSDPLPQCFVGGATIRNGQLQLRTCTGDGKWWAHGILPGDWVQFRGVSLPPPRPEAVQEVASLRKPARCEVAGGFGEVAVVGDGVDPAEAPYTLCVPLHCISVNALDLTADRCWTVCTDTAVYPSFYFDRRYCPRTVHPEMLGLTPHPPQAPGTAGFCSVGRKQSQRLALVFGSVGDTPLSLDSAPLHGFPLSAWSIYRMDPPELLIVELNKGKLKSSLFLQHIHQNNVTAPFARLNLSSLFREGGTRAEIFNSSSDSLSVFNIALRNPDGTTYSMHGGAFTFTLNMYT